MSQISATRTTTLQPVALQPFGAVVTAARAGADAGGVPTGTIEGWVRAHRVVVLRGFAPLPNDALTAFGARLGDVLEWEFGSVNQLEVKADSRNYLYTTHEVPFHWDGAFVGRVPQYIVFQCDEAPSRGGETLFADTTRVLAGAPRAALERWEHVSVTYSTEKIVHYGGSFTAPLLSTHPATGERVLRFAEPVEDLNPVRLEIHGVPAAERPAFLADLGRRIRAADACYAHAWRPGDIVIADNHALLHGRAPFQPGEPRRIRRVNVL